MLSSPIHLSHHRSAVAPLLLSCRTAIAPLLHRYYSAVAALSHRCRTDIATLSLCCRSDVALLSHHYRYNGAPPLFLCCRVAVAPLLHRYSSTVAPLLPLLILLRSRTAIAPLSLRCRCYYHAVVPLLHRYAPLPLRCRCCRFCCRNGITSAIAPAVTHGRRLKRHNQCNSFHQ